MPISIATTLPTQTGQAGDSDQYALCWVLGLDTKTFAVIEPRDWIRMAAQISSVSYRHVLTREELLTIIVNGVVPTEAISNMIHIVDEAPLQVVVMAAEQISKNTKVPLSVIWKFIQKFSEEWGLRRQRWILDSL